MLDTPRLIGIQREKIRRGGLHEFVRQAWHIVETSPFVDNWHLGQKCAVLEAVSRNQLRNVAINEPPGMSKSLICSVFWPAWEWAEVDPGRRSIAASFDASLTARDATRLLGLVSDPWYRNRWPGMVEPCNADLKFRGWHEQPPVGAFWTSRGGFRLSTSVGGKATGWHADTHLYDDLLKPKNVSDEKATVASETQLKSVRNWLKGTMASRFRDKAKGKRVMLMQRICEGDPTDVALEEWADIQHLRLPMRFEAEEPSKVYAFPNIPSQRKLIAEDKRTVEGELLFPKRFPEEVVKEDEEKNMGPYIAAAQLQQRPAPAKGGMVQKEHFRRYDTVPKAFDRLITVCDCNFKQTQSGSYAVIDLWGVIGPNAYLLPGWYRERAEYAAFEPAYMAFHEASDLHKQAIAKLVEDKANGPALMSKMKKLLPGVQEFPKGAGEDKIAMFAAVTPYFASGNVWHPSPVLDPRIEEREKELFMFPNGRNNDQVDTTSMALLHLFEQVSMLEAAMKALGKAA